MSEERITRLEQALSALTEKVDKLEARAAIENLMGRYQYLHTASLDVEILDKLWSHSDEAGFEDTYNGVYSGWRGQGIPDYFMEKYGMERYMPPMEPPPDMPPMPGGKGGNGGPPPGSMPDFPPSPPRKKEGRMIVHTMTTPVIEVDGDRAYGVWISSGHESGAFTEEELSNIPRIDGRAPNEFGEKVLADWVWLKYGVHFIREKGQWKILKMHIYDIFRCPFGEDWVTFSHRRMEEEALMDSQTRFGMSGTTPGGPTTFHWQYTTDSIPPLEPVPPEPGWRSEK